MVRSGRGYALALAVLVVAVLGACRDQATPRPSSDPARWFTVGTTVALRDLDPAVASASSWTLLANLYQTPLTMDAGGGPTPVPDATECAYESPTRYACTMRTERAEFPNGHRLDSADVKFSIERARRIAAARGTVVFGSLAAVTVRDSETVVFSLRRRDATFPYQLTTAPAAIVDEQLFPAATALADAAVVGSGPYRLSTVATTATATATATPGRLVLARNPDYRGDQRAGNDQVTIQSFASSKQLTDAVLTGTVDVATGELGPIELTALSGAKSVQVVHGPVDRTRLWTFRLDRPAVRPVAVRQAVAQLVDRAAIVKNVYHGQVRPLESVIPAGIAGQLAAFQERYPSPDVARAATLLRAGRVRPPVSLVLGWNGAGEDAQRAGLRLAEARALKAQLERSKLFRVALRRAPDAATFVRERAAGRYDLTPLTRAPRLFDADSFLSPLLRAGLAETESADSTDITHTTGSTGSTGFTDPPDTAGYASYASAAAIRLLEAERIAQSQLQRTKVLAELQRLVASDVPVLPLWQDGPAAVVMAVPQIRGLDRALTAQYLRVGYLSR